MIYLENTFLCVKCIIFDNVSMLPEQKMKLYSFKCMQLTN